jgi:hypothetical protein
MRPSAAAYAAAGGLFAVASLLSCPACSSPGAVAFETTPAAALQVVVSTDPPARADGSVPRDARFVVALDDYIDPGTVSYGNLTLRSSTGSFDFAWDIDFVGRRIRVTPRSLLLPGAAYTLVVTRLAGLDGRAQAGTTQATARAGSDQVGTPAPAATPTWNGEIGAKLRACGGTCHTRADGAVPPRALDLTGDPRDPVYGLVAVRATGTLGDGGPLLRVAPGQPAASVLLRKLVGGNPHADSRDEPYPNVGVDGQRMPPGEPALDDVIVRRVQDWIAGGAPID